jgi:hypothetical protein
LYERQARAFGPTAMGFIFVSMAKATGAGFLSLRKAASAAKWALAGCGM